MLNHYRAIQNILWITLFVIIVISPLPASGQSSKWSEPLNISNSAGQSTDQSLTVDSAGIVHLVWVEEIEKNTPVILYTKMEKDIWSVPVDIIAHVNRQDIKKPILSVDTQGYLHLLYNTGGLTYTRVNSLLADSVQNWQDPQVLVPARNYLSVHDFTIGPEDDLHLVYAIQNGSNSGIYHLSSNDYGQHWNGPHLVYGNPYRDRFVDKPKITVDEQGKLHIVWIETGFPDTSSSPGIVYSNNTDGLIWGNPVTLAKGPYFEPEIASTQNDIHVIWSGTWSDAGDDRFKFHIWSDDGGVNWSDVWRNQALGGLTGVPALVFDSAGRVYWLQIGDVFEVNDEGLYENIFTDRTWDQGTLVLRSDIEKDERDAVAVIGLGNELHVTAWYPTVKEVDEWMGDIFYLHKTLDSPHVQAQLLTIPTNTASSTTTQHALATEAPITVTSSDDGIPNQQSTYTVQTIIAWSVAPVVLLIVVLFVFRWLKSELSDRE